MTARHALITGASRGIGAAIAERLARDGLRLSLLGRDRAALEALAARLPRGPHATFAADVADETQVRRAFDAARERFGAIAVLVNNAGIAESAPLLKTSLEQWQRLLAVNLTGTFLCTQAALPGMLQAGWGRIVNIASTAGLKGYPYVGAYVAAKHGVVGLTRSLALEVAAKGITVNALCPGYTETDILRESIANVVAKTGRSEAQARASFVAGNPQQRLVQPEEVADAVAWLCGDGAAAVNGQTIAIAGGEA